ncbi:hypothetical protein [Streptomyces sp. NPDC050504]|uniref:hypothetical protein n=1 Tax=Streptomyces sp. NPDC050504 TaxID=3365618 RepID=UPI00379D4455
MARALRPCCPHLNGILRAWHHDQEVSAKCYPDAAPKGAFPPVHKSWDFSSYAQEIMENIVGVDHFALLHRLTRAPMSAPATAKKYTLVLPRARSSPHSWKRAVARLLIRAMLTQVSSGSRQDLRALQYKEYPERPQLAAGDGPIVKFRHWARTFHPEPTASGAVPSPLGSNEGHGSPQH